MAVATYMPSSIYLGGASGNLSANFYIPNTNTNSAGALEGIGVVSSLASSTSPYSAVLQFNLGTTSTGALTLRALATSNASTGTAKFTVNDGLTAPGSNIGATSLTAEAQSSVSWSTTSGPDVLKETNITLATAATSNGILTCRIDFNSTGAWTLAQTSNWQFSITQ